MKRKLYSVAYVTKLKLIASKMNIYREMNKKTEDAFTIMFRDFLASDEEIAEKFLEFAKTYEGIDSEAELAKINKVALEIEQLLNETENN